MSLNSDQEATNNRVPRKFSLRGSNLENALIACISVLRDSQADDLPERPELISHQPRTAINIHRRSKRR